MPLNRAFAGNARKLLPFLTHPRLPNVTTCYFKGSPYHHHLYSKAKDTLHPSALVYVLDYSAVRLAL